MATFEQIGLVFQIIHNIYGLVANMRDNADGYKTQLATRPVADIAAVMVADAMQYKRRVQWITDLAARNLALFDASLGALNLTRADAISLRDTLLGVTNHTQAANLTSSTEITTEADYILATVPSFERLW